MRHSDNDERRPRKKLEQTQAYRAYKTQLNQLFSGQGNLPEALKEKLEDSGMAQEVAAKKNALDTLLQAKTGKDMVAALQNYEQAYGFPQHEEAWAKLLELEHAPTLLRVFEAIEKYMQEHKLKRSASLKERILAAQIAVDVPSIQQAAATLLKKISSMA